MQPYNKLPVQLDRQFGLVVSLEVAEHLPQIAGTFVHSLTVDQEQLRERVGLANQAIPFLERSGQYWGPPPDDDTAIRELTRLRESGAKFLVFAWRAFWWLEYYTRFHRKVCSDYRCVLKNERLVVFDLRR